MINKRTVFVKVSNGNECDLSYVCNIECKKLHSLLYDIENELDIDLKNYPEIRKKILDSSNFIKRIPDTITDVIGGV